MQEALQESELKFRTLFESANDAIFLMEFDRFIGCNKKAVQMFGCTTEDQIVGKTPYFFSPPKQPDGQDSRDKAIAGIQAALGGVPQFFEWKHRRIDDLLLDAEVSLHAVELRGKKFLQAIVRDITERQQARKQEIEYQKQIAHASRLSTIGEMASRLTHELNQPFCAILAGSEACLRMLKAAPDAAVAKELDAIANQAERAGKIINRMKRFLRKDPVKFTAIDINAIIKDVVSFVEVETKRIHAKVNLILDPSNPAARGDAIQIEQVVLNLVKNGLDVMEEADWKPRMLTISTAVMPDSNMIEVAVCDSGKGIAPDNIDKLFEPFFTTKPYGLGVGLPVSKSIIESHGGKINVTPNANRGVTFRFKLPITAVVKA